MRLGGRLQGAIEVLADIEARKRPVADALKDWGLGVTASPDRAIGLRSAISSTTRLRMRLSHA